MQLTMMKNCALILATLLASAFAAPAVVWHSNEISNGNGRALHSSEDLSASDLLKNVLSEAPEADLSAVVFLVGKGEDGSEQLSELASSGKLPNTSSKYNDASGVYHHISGLESTGAMVRAAGRHSNDKNRVLEVSLSEFNNKLKSLSAPAEVEIDSKGNSKSANKRSRALSQADVYIVNISSKQDAALIDNSITGAIESKHVGSVVLAGVRSVDEVKRERFLISQRRMLKMEQDGIKMMEAKGRRRLDEAGDENANGDENSDLSGVYYVHMTPNIFSGLLFFLLFTVVAFTGISCLGDIQGGDVYVDKYPSLGREA